MSKLLEDNSSFLSLLLNTKPAQALDLLSNVTPSQGLCINEICFNLLSLPLTTKEAKIVKKRKTLLKKLSKKSIPFKTKTRLICSNKKTIYKILISFKSKLLELI